MEGTSNPRAKQAASVEGPSSKGPISPLALGVLVLAGALAVMSIMSGFGSRWGWWHFGTGFSMLRWGAYGGIAVALLSIFAIVWTRPGTGRRGLALAVSALLISILLFAGPYSLRQMARQYPPINDITTDTQNPPEFVEVATLRAEDENSTEYGGPDMAAQQMEAYPDIESALLEMPYEQAFEHALNTVRNMRWEVVAADIEAGHIEATDQTFWYGFKDDVVIRLTPSNENTRVDVRSQSRVGRGDLGVNARRVRAYLRRLGAR